MICALALCASMMPTAVFAAGDQDAGTGTDISTSASQSDENNAPDSGDTLPEDTNKTVNENSNGNGVDSTAAKGDGEETTGDTEGTGDSETTGSTEGAGSGDENGTVVTDEENKPADTPDEDNNAGLAATYSAPETRAGANIYENADLGIYIDVEQGSGRQSAQFAVMVDGEIVADDISIDGLSLLGNKLTIDVPEGYDVRCRGMDGNVRADEHELLGYWWFYPYDGTLYISITTSKTSDDVTVADGSTTYGTFSWMKGEADTAAFPRRLTVYVNGDYAYQRMVATPADLKNVGSNRQYWFTPNTDLYNMDVELKDGTTLNQATLADLEVYLTTKCPCGHSYCTCPGGKDCTCTTDCDCELCNPAQGETEIRTPYGTMEYKKPSGEGYNLTVELYVNGQLKQTVDDNGNPLRVRVGEIDCLNFTPADGYYYFNDQNSYDISTAYGGSWDQRTGYLMIVLGSPESARDYDNVLKIYLWTFQNHTKLDVERRPGSWGGDANIQDNMTGYMISYEAYNPETKQNETFTYQATSFLLAQSQMIPIGAPVTITAICNAPYEVSAWSSADAYTAVDLVGSEGNSNQTTANGNSATLTVNSTDYISVTVYAEGLRTVTPPTEEDLINNTDDIFGAGNSAVIVDCLNTDANHADQTYGLKEKTFAISDLQGDSVNGYYVTVTITDPDAYVTAYDQAFTDVTHERADSDTKTIRLNWEVVEKNGVKESQWKAEEAATLGVTCKDTTPTKPDDNTVKELLEQKVLVKCTNGDNTHDDMSKAYGALEGGYTVGEVQGDATSGYTVDVTILCDTYVTQYNTETNSKHVLESGEPAEKTITLQYDADLDQWQSPAEQTVINVTCKVDKPTAPDDNTVKELLKNQILVRCVNTDVAHGEKTYDLLDGSYKIGTVQGSETTGYTVAVTITNSDYLTRFNSDLKVKHELVSDAESTVTLRYVVKDDVWKVDTELPVEIQVSCKDVVDADIVITPEDLTIYRGGEVTEENGSNYNIVDENGDIMGNTGSLPEIGFSLQLSTDLNQKLHDALKVSMDEALDLAGRITLTAKTSDGKTTLEWELKHYGSEDGSSVTTTGENGFYIYKIVPVGDTEGAKLNVSFINNEGDYVNTDAFEIEDDNKLAETYTMMIYGDRVDASTLSATITYGNGTSETVSVQGAEKPATLTVRYTNTDASITHSFDTVAEASESEDENDQSKLTQSAYMIRKDAEGNPADHFMVNNSDVQVDGQDVSLLFDDIAETESTNYEDTLKTKAVDAVKDKNADVDTSKLKTEAKYLDLVDATNGNVWVTTDDDVTIYWPFPKGTDASTTFYVAHFDGLDRDKDVSGMTTEVNGATATLMDVKTDQYGVYFTTKKFSPYVLVWDTTKSSGGNGGNGGGGTTTTTTDNNNTNNNTTTVNVTSTAAAQPQAATAAIPQTGDAMPVGLLGGLAAAAAAGFAALFVIRKRKQNG